MLDMFVELGNDDALVSAEEGNSPQLVVTGSEDATVSTDFMWG